MNLCWQCSGKVRVVFARTTDSPAVLDGGARLERRCLQVQINVGSAAPLSRQPGAVLPNPRDKAQQISCVLGEPCAGGSASERGGYQIQNGNIKATFTPNATLLIERGAEGKSRQYYRIV